MNDLMTINHINQKLPDNDGNLINILDDINFSVKKGEFVSVIGPSGCGKTTLLRMISGLAKPYSGTITMDGKTVTKPDISRGYVFQHDSLFPWETVQNNIASGLKVNHRDKDLPLVKKYIKLMGLDGFEDAFPNQISGGMAQRAALARSLILRPEILLLDEPMGALDAFTRADIQKLIYQVWQQTKTSMVLITHDINEAVYLSQKIVIMTPRPGRVKKIIENPLPFPRNRESKEFVDFSQEVQSILNFH